MNLTESINKQRKMMGLNELENSDSLNEAMFDKLKTNVAGVGSFFTGKGFEQGKLKKQVKFNVRDIDNNMKSFSDSFNKISDKVKSNVDLTTKLTTINRANIVHQRQSANMLRMLDTIGKSVSDLTRYLNELDKIV